MLLSAAVFVLIVWVCGCVGVQVQEAFAACALDVKRVFEVKSMQWSSFCLSHITTLLLRANKREQAW